MALLVGALSAVAARAADRGGGADQGGAADGLEAVVVTESRIPEELSGSTRSFEVATGEQIRASSAEGLADFLTRYGFQLRADRGPNYGDQTITIRGLSTSVFGTDLNTDILVLVDGRRSGTDSLSLIDPNLIERVEVIRGPGAVQYGSSAMGGVINVITIRGTDRLRVRLEGGLGRYGVRRGAFSVSGQSGAFDLAAGISYGRAGNWSDGRGVKKPHSSMGGRLGYLARAGWSFGGGHRLGITIQGAELDNLGGWVGASASSLRSYVQYQDKTMESAELLYEGSAGRLSWSARWFSGRTGYSLERHPSMAGRGEPSYLGAVATNDFQGAQAQLAWSGEALSAVAGADWLEYDFLQIQAATATSPRTTGQSLYRNLGLYLLMKYRPAPSLVLSAGLRSDRYRVGVDNLKGPLGASPAARTGIGRSFGRILPSVGAAWRPWEGLRLRANWAMAYKAPSPRQLAGNYYMGSTLFEGDPSIRPEESETADLGADLELGPLTASLGWFRTGYRDLISFRRISGSPPVSRYLNVEAAVIEGMEASAGLEAGPLLGLEGSLALRASWTRLFRYRSRDGLILPDIARDSLGVGLAWSIPSLDLDLGLDGTWLGAIDVAGSYANQTPSGRTAGVMIWDLAATKGLGMVGPGRLKLKVSVKNVLDEFYDTSDGDVMPGLTVFGALSWEIG
jgi:vitamin B12 transporter